MSGIINAVTGFPSFTSTNFRLVTPVQTSTTFGGKMRRVGIGTSYYTFTMKFPPMTQTVARPLIGFLGSQYGMLDSFQVYLPIESVPRAGFSGAAPTVSQNYDAGVRQIVISAEANSTVLRQGDFFKFTGNDWISGFVYNVGNYVRYNSQDWYCHTAHTSGASFDSSKFQLHSKVYMAIADCVSSGAGSATLDFACGSLLPLNGTARLNVTSVPFTVMLAGDVQEYEVGVDRMFMMEVDVREVL